jgi:hypothetical protein
MILIRRLQVFGSVPLTQGALLPVLAVYERPNDKIADLLSKGMLVQLRRGLYVLGADHRSTPLSLPLVANLLFGPSSVSLDFALGWHGLICAPRHRRELGTLFKAGPAKRAPGFC